MHRKTCCQKSISCTTTRLLATRGNAVQSSSQYNKTSWSAAAYLASHQIVSRFAERGLPMLLSSHICRYLATCHDHCQAHGRPHVPRLHRRLSSTINYTRKHGSLSTSMAHLRHSFRWLRSLERSFCQSNHNTAHYHLGDGIGALLWAQAGQCSL